MTNEVDIMRKAVAEYDKAVKLKRLNQELYDHLLGSLVWLLKYSEKYSIPLSQKEDIYKMVKRAEYLIDRILDENHKSLSPSPPTRDQHDFKHQDDSRLSPVTPYLF